MCFICIICCVFCFSPGSGSLLPDRTLRNWLARGRHACRSYMYRKCTSNNNSSNNDNNSNNNSSNNDNSNSNSNSNLTTGHSVVQD